jgi:hypothetical protein
MCSRLPDILFANLLCLNLFRWPQLKHVIVSVDCPDNPSLQKMRAWAVAKYPELHVQFVFYSQAQSKSAEALNLPYVYSWLSWCNALKCTTTEHVLIHDYDALVLGHALENRYRNFQTSGATIQGISWYRSNGIVEEDRLASTFCAFVRLEWLRSMRPVALFNKLRLVRGRSIDFDTTLDAQHRLLSERERTIQPMSLSDLVHPSQMIHQYTMFRRLPASNLPCFSIPMIPFFNFLSGKIHAVEHATRVLKSSERADMDLLGDGTRINLTSLDIGQVDWMLKQIVQACLGLGIAPNQPIYDYGNALYAIIGTPTEAVWRGDYTKVQRAWIDAASFGLESVAV